MKNYCRRILSLLLALCMSVTLCQITAFAFEVDFSRYALNGDYYMVNFNVIGIPQNPVPDNYSDCTIGGEIEYSYGAGTGCKSSPKYDLGTEVGAYHFPTDEQTGIAELTIFPDPGVKITGIAKAINGGAPFLYGNISIGEIPANVYSGSAVTGDLSGIEEDGSYTLYFNIPTTDALSTTNDSYFAVKYEAASPDEIPDAPTNLKWTRDEANSAWVLSWDTVADAEKYRYNVIFNYFNHDYSLIADVTDTNKLVLSDSEFGTYNVPCDLKVKVSSVKNKVRSEDATSPKHNLIMKKDDTEHWNQCSACNYLDAMSRAAHSYGEWIIDTEATAEAPGRKHRECACGYVQNGTVIYDGDDTPGDIHNATDPVNNALHADLELTDEDIINKIPLTPEEREAIENGEDLTVYMIVIDYSGNVPPEDKALAEAQLNGMEKGMYLDIKLFKQIGGNEPAAVTQTNEGTSLKVTFVMPESLKNQDSSKERTYKIIRVHNGKAEPLTVSYDPATGLGSFYTDRFSTYLLAYTDTGIIAEETVTKYPINNPTNGIVKTDKSSAAAGERVSVSVMPGYIAHIVGNNGNEIARISGTGSFIMPAGSVRITAEYPVNFAITWNNSYIYSYDSDMNYITVNRTRKQGTINVDLGKKYAGRSFVIYEGKKSTKVKVTEGVLDADGKITLDVSDGKNYTLVVEDQ